MSWAVLSRNLEWNNLQMQVWNIKLLLKALKSNFP